MNKFLIRGESLSLGNGQWTNPSTIFEAWKNLLETETPYNTTASQVEFVLIGEMDHSEWGYCYPSMATILKKSGIKSSSTVRLALDELVDSGRWFIERVDKRTPRQGYHYYYPQFIENPMMPEDRIGRTDLDWVWV